MRLIAKEGEWGCDVSRSKYLQEEKRRRNRPPNRQGPEKSFGVHKGPTCPCQLSGWSFMANHRKHRKIDPIYLNELYWGQFLSTVKIAKITGVGVRSVLAQMKIAGIQ